MVPEMKAALLGALVGGVLAIIGGFLATMLEHGLQRKREKRQREREQKDLAAGLADELDNLAGQLSEIVCRDKEHQELEKRPRALTSLAGLPERSTIPVFDSSGIALRTLPPEVASEVASCYSSLRTIVDSLSEVHRTFESLTGLGGATEPANDAHQKAYTRLITASVYAVERAKALVQNLRMVAEGKYRPPSQ